MPDVMVIVSKAVFEKAAGKTPKLGDQLGMDRYVTANKALEPVRGGGKLYLVTVRPPNEALWLVAVLENPKFDGKQWKAKPCTTPMTDISSLRSKIKFDSGKGISAAAGTLGMSLQTPRVLSVTDTVLLDNMLGIAAPAPTPAAPIGTKGEGIPKGPDKPRDANTGERRQGDALLQAVLDDPLSDAPRQVYADALQARNDPRGELIQIDLALAGPLSIRKRDILKRQRDALLKANATTWFPTKLAYRTSGGFISSVSGSLGKILKDADLFDTQPVVELHATDVDEKAVAKLVKAPWLGRIRHLALKGSLGDDGFVVLASSPAVQQLTELNALGTRLTADAIAALDGYLPNCHTLVLTANNIGDKGVDALLAWKHLGQVETLYLSRCGITKKGLTSFFNTKLPRLVKLTLSDNALDDSIAELITAKAANFPALQHLEIKGAKLSPKFVAAMKDAKLSAIRRVDVRKNKIKESDVADMPVFRGGIQ